MIAQKYVWGARRDIFTQYQLNRSSWTSVEVAPLASNRMYRRTYWRSSGVRNFESAGVLGMKKKHTMPNTTVIAPSTINSNASQFQNFLTQSWSEC